MSTHLRRGNDRQFLADRFGVDSQLGLGGCCCVAFLIKATRRRHRLLLLLSRHGNLLQQIQTLEKKIIKITCFFAFILSTSGIRRKTTRLTFSALKLSVVSFMLAAAVVRLSCCVTSPAFNERCSYFLFGESHKVENETLIRWRTKKKRGKGISNINIKKKDGAITKI